MAESRENYRRDLGSEKVKLTSAYRLNRVFVS